jgi:hypothetical protein
VADLDVRLRRAVEGFHRLRWVLVTVLGTLALIGIIVLGILLINADQRLTASCNFYRDLAQAPLTAKPPPSRLGIHLLADSRKAFRGQNCTGTLPPPSPGLMHWAGVYRIQL